MLTYYISLLSRWLNSDFINLGFSGSAKGEQKMADYLASLSPSIFVIDYDCNAPTAKHLEKTHYNLYETIRKSHPDIPYFMITKPDFRFNEDCIGRRDIVMKSYLEARAAGDKNVYFIDGSAFFNGADINDMTLDCCHPNDEGFGRMATYIGDVIAKVMDL